MGGGYDIYIYRERERDTCTHKAYTGLSLDDFKTMVQSFDLFLKKKLTIKSLTKKNHCLP